MKVFAVFVLAFLSPAVSSASDLLPNWQDLDDYRRQWYSRHLSTAGEAAIRLSKNETIYRFTWLRTFHSPILIRVQCSEHCDMHATVLSGAGGYDPGEIEDQFDRALTDEESEKLTSLFEATNFWVGQPNSRVNGRDGAQWIFEASDGDRYMAWDVWSAASEDQYSEFTELCMHLLELTGFKIVQREIY